MLYRLVVASCALAASFAVGSHTAQAATKTAAEIVAGRFVVSVEQPTQVWYTHPTTKTRQVLGTWEDLQAVVDRSGAVIPAKEFSEIANDLTGQTFDDRLRQKLKGRLLLDPATGWLWYVSPKDLKRYRIGSPKDARRVFDLAKTGISQKNLDKIPTSDQASDENRALRKRLAGSVAWNVADGSQWYISVKDLKRYPLATTEQIATVLASQKFGVTATKLATIPQGTDALAPKSATLRKYSGRFVSPSFAPDEVWYVSPKSKVRIRVQADTLSSLVEGQKVTITVYGLASIAMVGEAEVTDATVETSRGSFVVKVLSSDLSLPGLKILTVAGDDDTCVDKCTTKSVGQFAIQYNGIAGINGGYFCPGGTAGCIDKSDSFYGQFYHSGSGVLLNEDLLPASVYPMLAFDANNVPYFYEQALTFVSLDHFTATAGAALQAAIANWPALIVRGVNVVDSQLLDSGQRNTKAVRVVLATKGKTVYFFVINAATVVDAAAVVETFGVDYAINLDGGSSTGLWRYGQYLKGPGRTVPNAIVIARTP